MTEALDEKLLLYISKTYKLSLLASSLIVDECLKNTSAKLNIDYNIIYNSVFSKECLSNLLQENPINCSSLTINSCLENCSCFYLEPYGCLPRIIKDAEKINEDPDKYVKEYLGKTEDLEKLVKIASYLYHNYDGGGLTDNSFDALEYHLKKKIKLKGRL